MGANQIDKNGGVTSGIPEDSTGASARSGSTVATPSPQRMARWRRLAASVGRWPVLSALFRERSSGADPVVPSVTDATAVPEPPAPPPPPIPPQPKLKRGQIEAKLLAGESLNGFDLSGADLRMLDFSRVAELHQSKLDGAELDRDVLSAMIANKARLATFGYHLFEGVRLNRAKLSGMNLDFCNFTSADFTGADLRGASVEGTVFTGADFQWAKMDARVIQLIKEGKTRLGKDGLHDFQEINLEGVDLAGADLSDLDLRRASFEKTNLAGADLTRARLDYSCLWKIFDGGRHDFQGVNLQDISLIGFPSLELLNLHEANLKNVLLDKRGIEALVSGGSRLQSDGFHDFRGVCLKTMDLRGVDLRNLDLRDADLVGAHLGRKELEDIILSGTRKNQDTGLHDLQRVNLAGVDLTGIDLSSVDLDGARLENARLDRRAVVSLIQNGSRLNLNGYHDFCGVNLAGVDLRGIDLSQVDLRGTNLENVQIDREQIVSQIFYRLYCRDSKPFRTNLPISHEIWDEIENLTPFLSPSDLFQVATLIPDVNINIREMNYRLIQIAILVTRVLDRVEYGAFRTIIHNQPFNGHGNAIALYLSLAENGKCADGTPLKQAEQKEMIALLEEAQKLDPQIYEAQQAMRHSQDFARELTDLGILYARGDHSLNAIFFVGYALQIRKRMTAENRDASGRIRLARVLKVLDSYAFRAFAPAGKEEIGTVAQAEKMGALVLFLYGCGYGNRAWWETGARLMSLAKIWNEQGDGAHVDDLYRYGVLAYQFIEEVKDSYHGLFDPVLARYREAWQVDPALEREFTRNIYRLGGVFQLGLHVTSLNVRPGGRNTIERVLDIMGREPLNAPISYQAHFFDEEGIDDVRVLGGKGRGLRRLTKNAEKGGYKVPAGFTLPPLLLREWELREACMKEGCLKDGHLTSEQIQIIVSALAQLEEKTGRSFLDGSLKVSVRSGACVSMPGMMSTELNVSSIADVVDAVERVYKSWDSERAVSFRRLNGIPHDWGTSVSIVAMVNGEKDENSGAGVVSSHSADGMERGIQYTYGLRVLGEELVSNRHKGTSPLPSGLENRLKKVVKFWERELNYPVELEFTVESGELYLLQIRRARLEYEDEIRWVHSMVHHERMSRKAGIDYLGGSRRLKQALMKIDVDLCGDEIPVVADRKGTGSPVSGRLVFDKSHIAAIQEGGARFVYVTDDPDAGNSYEALLLAGAVVTTGGNPLSHLAVVAREQRMSYMAGVDVQVDQAREEATIGKTRLKKGDWITMDPAKGRIFHGKLPIKEGPSEVVPLIETLLAEEEETPPGSSGPSGGGSRGRLGAKTLLPPPFRTAPHVVAMAGSVRAAPQFLLR